ncbi:hypothetical protein LZP69_12810 [Shewanella sp. AS1]|uniref:hypothetical protein n=1 Tax=Shewanella sp. AS1 TaxID=2907626 RepID=UPI001F17309D|nr:hypothetical protein [Shewanella sp. AS1]MCE9680045.1 hypothetical protein [Shewanella sp. AS1]
MPKVTHTDSYQLNHRSIKSDSKLIPVNIRFSPKQDTLLLSQHHFRVQYLQPENRLEWQAALIQKQGQLLLNLGSVTLQVLDAELQLTGTVKRMPLPQALLTYIKENQLPVKQLMQLAERPQGYPVGEIKISNNLAHFPAVQIKLSPGQFSNGQFNATLVLDNLENRQLQIALAPILKRTQVLLHPKASQQTALRQQTAGHANHTKETAIPSKGQAEAEPASQNGARLNHHYGQLVSSLSKYLLTPEPVAKSPAATSSTSLLQYNLVNSNSVANLNAAANSNSVAKAGADSAIKSDPSIKSETVVKPETIIKSETVSRSESLLGVKAETSTLSVTTQAKPRHRGLDLALNLLDTKLSSNKATEQSSMRKLSLLSLVKQLHPLLLPRPLSELAAPGIIRQELIDSALIGNLTPADSKSMLSSHSSTIGILFQLLLGRQHTNRISPELNQRLQALQQGMAMDANILGLLEKADTLSSLGKLISGLHLYQQASSDTLQGNNWYFTLPYMLNNRQENFEGHFEQEAQTEGKKKCWRLRLKFNLTAGAVLINAEVKDKQLRLSFTASSDKLLENITTKLQPLSDKITAIGLTSEAITAHKDKVPRSLLPGDNQLGSFKVKV